jgi:hypothetical protein
MTDKLSAIQRAQKHFQGKLAGALKEHYVEEWDMTVFYREISNLKQEAKIVELATQGKNVEALVQTVLDKALDKEGKPLFQQADRAALMNEADPAVVLKLSRVLNGSDLPSVGEIEKN